MSQTYLTLWVQPHISQQQIQQISATADAVEGPVLSGNHRYLCMETASFTHMETASFTHVVQSLYYIRTEKSEVTVQISQYLQILYAKAPNWTEPSTSALNDHLSQHLWSPVDYIHCSTPHFDAQVPTILLLLSLLWGKRGIIKVHADTASQSSVYHQASFTLWSHRDTLSRRTVQQKQQHSNCTCIAGHSLQS